MLMEINEKYGQRPADYARRLEAEPKKVKEAGKEQNGEKTPDKPSDLHDEYISSERSGVKPSGLYRLGQDGNGNPKVLYDDPKKADGTDKKEQPKVGADKPEEDAEKCTTNTDQVDREIKKLKEQKQQLEQQIKAAAGDEAKGKELERKLSQIESELRQKDNDTYRRQNAVIS